MTVSEMQQRCWKDTYNGLQGKLICVNKINLFFTMLKIGIFTFGGGYAMIALLENEFVNKKKWIKNEEFMDMIAVSESTPGPISVNCATYLGYRVGGYWGAVVATMGVVIPSFVIIFVISLFFETFMKIRLIKAAFRGIQVCMVYLIARAGIRMFKNLKKTRFQLIVMLLVCLCMVVGSILSIQISSVWYIIISGVVGVVIQSVKMTHT